MRCPACRGALAPWRTAPAAEPGGPPYALSRCVACGTAVTGGPRPAPGVHEAGAYGAVRPRGAGLAAPLLRAFDAQRLALLRRAGIAPPARVLDAGAGRGRFVSRAREAGYAADGLEPSERGTAAAREVYGVALQRAGVEDAQIPTGSADAVTLWHVLEHVGDPDAALGRVASWLAPGGVLVVGVPNLASAQARIGGARWYHLDLPRHRTHFTPAGLEALLTRHGLRVERTVHVLAEQNPFGMWQTLVNRATRTPSYLYLLLKRAVGLDARDLAVTLAALPLLPPAALAELAAGLARRGGTVAVVARRPAA